MARDRAPRDKGFVPLDKGLYDAILVSPMSGVQKDVVWAAVRWTQGHYRGYRPHDAAPLGLAWLAKKTGHHRNTLSIARQELVREGVLVQTREHEVGNRAAEFYVNEDPTTWGRYSVNLRWSAGESLKSGQEYQRDGDGVSVAEGQDLSTKQVSRNNNEEPYEEREEALSHSIRESIPMHDPVVEASVASWVEAHQKEGLPTPSRHERVVFETKIKTLPEIDLNIMKDTINRMVEQSKGPHLAALVYGDLERECEQELLALQAGRLPARRPWERVR